MVFLGREVDLYNYIVAAPVRKFGQGRFLLIQLWGLVSTSLFG